MPVFYLFSLLLLKQWPVYFLILSVHARRTNRHCVRSADWIWIFTEQIFIFTPNAGKYRPEKLRIRTLFMHESHFHNSVKNLRLWFFNFFKKIQSFYGDKVLNLKDHFIEALVNFSKTKLCFEKTIYPFKWFIFERVENLTKSIVSVSVLVCCEIFWLHT